MLYIVAFLAGAAFPLALAAYGGHLAAVALEGSKRRHALLIVWGLAALGVLFSALQQYGAFRSDNEHDRKQAELQQKLDTSLQRQEYARGQLDSISLMVGKVGEKSQDPVMAQLAGTIAKMAQDQRAVPAASGTIPDLHIRIMYEGADLNGRTILVPADSTKQIRLSEFQIHNGGDRDTGQVSLRLYLTQSIAPMIEPPTLFYPWVVTASDEVGYVRVFFSAGGNGAIVINPTETWNWLAFSGRLNDEWDEIACKLKVFYGASRPAEATFIVRKKK